ncbi:MAG: hypothetical protein ACE5IY_07985 [bacterium]
MKSLIPFFLVSIFNLTLLTSNDSAQPDDTKIARAIRQAVRDAEPELLKSTLTGSWREYLKIAAMDLEMQLQPLVLIKFDEDISFRNQLKKIIEWEANWHRKETKHYVYYYRWDQPLPELILEFQDAHLQEVCEQFGITIDEKIPYRYDLEDEDGTVYPFEDLRAGIVSPHPFDLEKAALAIFSSVNSGLKGMIQPLARLYGSYFQNGSTAQAYYDNCLQVIKTRGYRSPLELLPMRDFDANESQDWHSAFAFVYQLDKQFGPKKIKEFLSRANSDMSQDELQEEFEQVFETSITEFESSLEFYPSVEKL